MDPGLWEWLLKVTKGRSTCKALYEWVGGKKKYNRRERGETQRKELNMNRPDAKKNENRRERGGSVGKENPTIHGGVWAAKEHTGFSLDR